MATTNMPFLDGTGEVIVIGQPVKYHFVVRGDSPQRVEITIHTPDPRDEKTIQEQCDAISADLDTQGINGTKVFGWLD